LIEVLRFACKIILSYSNIQIVYDNMRSSVKLRFFIFILFTVTLQIFLYFAKQGHIADYVIYILFAMFSVPTFLYVYLGSNGD